MLSKCHKQQENEEEVMDGGTPACHIDDSTDKESKTNAARSAGMLGEYKKASWQLEWKAKKSFQEEKKMCFVISITIGC